MSLLLSPGSNASQSRHQLPEQIPSSSSNLALPQYTAQQAGSTTRLQATTDTRREENPSSSYITPPHVPEKDRKRQRSRRDRAAAQQNAHESGFSSSEQELSGRERPPVCSLNAAMSSVSLSLPAQRPSERRHAARDPYNDTHQSGPSGSETERVMGRERVRFWYSDLCRLSQWARFRHERSVGHNLLKGMPPTRVGQQIPDSNLQRLLRVRVRCK